MLKGATQEALGLARHPKCSRRGGAGTEKVCGACNWPIKAAAEHGVKHSKGGWCTWAGGELPCGVCGAAVATHTAPCVRGAGHIPKGWDALDALS